MSFKVLALAAVAASFSFVAHAGSKEHSESKAISFDQLKWVDMPGTPIKTATLWGDPSKGEYGRLMKLPGGFESGMHSHSQNYHGVLISGTWIHYEDEKNATELAPGSYVMQAGKKDHNDKCKAGADCILLLTQKSKHDYFPAKVAPAAKK